MGATSIADHEVVSREQWLAARKALLAAEKAHTRQHDELARRRRELPWVKVETNYVFDTPAGPKTLADLFAGRSQLVVYHFMLGPGWPEGCPSCSMAADGFDATALHLAQRDVTFIAVSRAPLSEIDAFKRRMGWRFTWASSSRNTFNRDYHVSFTKDEIESGAASYNYGSMNFPVSEAPGASVFYRNAAGEVFHTYSAYGRGLEPLLGVYTLLDVVPKGRDEDGLKHPMAWVRHHDRYEAAKSEQSACGCGNHQVKA
jgi:predicted dithiol-disulfide oxidoreductase (DUF899 family)